jgi:hypothetical protein
MKIFKKVLQKVLIWNVKRVKKRDFLKRWDIACDKLWWKFNQITPSNERFDWFYRKHALLMRVADNHIGRIKK